MSWYWDKTIERGNDGKKLFVWRCGAYEISENIFHGAQGPGGRKGGWWFEVTCKGRGVAQAPDLAGAKRLAQTHHTMDD